MSAAVPAARVVIQIRLRSAMGSPPREVAGTARRHDLHARTLATAVLVQARWREHLDDAGAVDDDAAMREHAVGACSAGEERHLGEHLGLERGWRECGHLQQVGLGRAAGPRVDEVVRGASRVR